MRRVSCHDGRDLSPFGASAVLEAALYITLGFAVASLLALMVAPAVWRQAVRITRNRIEASVPLTLNEIQADKDQLRAEFAMSTRRLEMNLDQLRERASTQVIEINRKRDQLSKVAEELRERQAELDGATAEGKRLAEELRERERKLAETEARLEETSRTLETRGKQLDDYETALKRATADVDSHKAELERRDERLERMDGAMRTSTVEADRLRADLAASQADTARERERAERLEEELDTLRRRVAELEAFVDERDEGALPVVPASGGAGEATDRRDEATDRRIEALETRNARLEADLSQALLRATAMAEAPNRDNADRAAAALHEENHRLSEELALARTELETQRIELAAAQLAGRDDYESERRENALVRERLNDLAARVTLMTAEMEGPGSAVERILAETPEPPRFAPEAYDTSDGRPPSSLADRIRALKELAEKE